MKQTLYFSLIIIFILYHHLVLSQDSNIKFSHLTVDDGLSQSWIRCIVQDKHGLIWIGTYSGLNCYNGYSFIEYKHHIEDTTSLSGDIINSLLISSDGNLWIATSAGFDLYNTKYDNFIRKDKILNNISIISIAEDKDSCLWLGSYSGLRHFNPKNNAVKIYWNNPLDNKSISANNVLTTFADSYNRIWIGTGNGLNLYDKRNGNFLRFLHNPNQENSISGNIIKKICEDKAKRLWIATQDGGLNLLILPYPTPKPEDFKFSNFFYLEDNPKSLSGNNLTSLIIDYKNNLWIGGLGLSKLNLARIDSNQNIEFERIKYDPNNPKSLSNESILSFLSDSQNNIWVGTYSGININHYYTDKFIHINVEPNKVNTLSNKQVNTFLEDNGNIWIGTEQGINIYNTSTKTFKHFFHQPSNNKSISSNSIWNFCKDKNGNLWIATWDGGLNLFDYKTETFTTFKNNPADTNSISSNNIFSLCEDNDGIIWIGTMGGGVSKFDTKTNKFSNTYQFGVYVATIFKDSKGELWFGDIGGLNRYNPKTKNQKRYNFNLNDPNSISYNTVLAMYEDSKGNFWLATEGGGLNIMDREKETFKKYKIVDGLPDNTIKGILEDSKGNLWLSSNNGICKFINAVNVPQNPEFKKYTTDDGLQSKEFVNRSCIRSKNGTMYFGGQNGFNIFHPDSIHINTYVPKVIITDFLIFNKPVKPGTENSVLKQQISQTKDLVINYNQSVLTFKYVGINYIPSGKNQYAYKMEGFEKNWNYVGEKREATYTNLDPGKYVFRVKVANNDGIWSKEDKSINITILPPFWKRWWAYFFYFAFLFSLSMLVIRIVMLRAQYKQDLRMEIIKREKEQELHRQKIEFFTNISHEFRTPLTLIAGPIENLLTNEKFSDRITEQLKIINRNSGRLLRLVNGLMDLSKFDSNSHQLNLQKGDIVKFTNEIAEFFTERAGRYKIKFSFKSLVNDQNIWFDIDMIDKVIFNLISNAFKYTKSGGEISVIINKVNYDLLKNINFNVVNYNNKIIKDTEYIEICVNDTGIGISKENYRNVFNRFFQINEPDITDKGTGIGLSLVKEYIEKHNGLLNLESEKGRGSSFYIYLPLSDSGNEILNSKKYPTDIIEDIEDYDSNSNNLTEKIETQDINNLKKAESPIILIVEDNNELRSYLKNEISSDFVVKTAVDGEDGYAKTIEFMPDLIISDVLMPKLNGLDLCKKIKSDIKTSHIPVILLTARITLNDKIKGLETGADVYITKPFSIKYLKVQAAKIIENRRMLYDRFIKKIDITPSDLSTNSLDQAFMNKVLDYVMKNISNPELTVETMSDDIGISRSQFYRKIKSLTGQSAVEFIRSIRLKTAANYLKTTKETINDIAYKTGFSSPSYFTKCFREHFGKTPSEYVND